MIDRKYFPSQKFLVALSIAIVVILVAIIFNYWKPSVTKYTNNNSVTDTTASSSIINIDSDNDGLVDWKENLYGTDPKKADTDGDGTNDADEVALYRNPLKANTALANEGPNDKIDLAVIEENKKALEEYEKLNEIDKFSQNLISNIIASQPVSGQMSTDTANSIVAKSLSELPPKTYSPVTKITDLTLQKTDSTNLSKNMTTYISKYTYETNKLVPLFGADATIIDSYISNDNKDAKSEMYKITDKYQVIVNNLIKIPVPIAIGYYDVNYHLKIINDLEMIIAIDKDIVNYSADSMGLFSNLSLFNNVTSDLLATLTKVDGLLQIQR